MHAVTCIRCGEALPAFSASLVTLMKLARLEEAQHQASLVALEGTSTDVASVYLHHTIYGRCPERPAVCRACGQPIANWSIKRCTHCGGKTA